MESIEQLAAEFLVAHSTARRAVEEIQRMNIEEKWDYNMEFASVIGDFDRMLRTITNQAHRFTARTQKLIRKHGQE